MLRVYPQFNNLGFFNSTSGGGGGGGVKGFTFSQDEPPFINIAFSFRNRLIKDRLH